MIKGKRAFLAGAIYYSRLHRGLCALESGRLTIFNYHRIRTDRNRATAFDEEVFGPTQEILREQLRWLKQNTDVVSEEDLLAHVQDGFPLPRIGSMVTFDDGYRDNAELALPVLREQGIPAIFFISTRAIQTRELGWWDTIAYLVKQSTRSSITLMGRTFSLGESRGKVIKEVQNWMRKLGSERTRSLIAELSAACGVPLPSSETCSRELMDWEQIREAARNGIAIGSHTHTHRVLSTLSPQDQIEEFNLSKEILEREIGREIRSIAYPVGEREDLHVESEKLAVRCGYQLGFSFQTGTNRLDRLNPLDICRVAAEETLPLTCAAIALPSVFARSRSAAEPDSMFLATACPLPP